MSQATLEARVWRELSDSGTSHRFPIADVDLALTEEARALANDSRIAGECRRIWTDADATVTVAADGKITYSEISGGMDKLISVILADDDGDTWEISNIVSPEGRSLPRLVDSDHPLPKDAIFIIDGDYYVSADYAASTATVHYIPTMTLSLAVQVHGRLEDALAYGAASRLATPGEPQTALTLWQKREASLPMERSVFTINPIF